MPNGSNNEEKQWDAIDSLKDGQADIKSELATLKCDVRNIKTIGCWMLGMMTVITTTIIGGVVIELSKRVL